MQKSVASCQHAIATATAHGDDVRNPVLTSVPGAPVGLLVAFVSLTAPKRCQQLTHTIENE